MKAWQRATRGEYNELIYNQLNYNEGYNTAGTAPFSRMPIIISNFKIVCCEINKEVTWVQIEIIEKGFAFNHVLNYCK